MGDFFTNIRWDVVITLVISILLTIVLMWKKSNKNKTIKRKKSIFVWQDFSLSLATSAVLYGGVSAIYFAIKGQLLFNQNLIISEEYIILFSGVVLVGMGINTFQSMLKKIR